MSSRSRKKGAPLDTHSDHTLTPSSLRTVESLAPGSSRSMQLVQETKDPPPKRIDLKPSGLPDIKLSEVYLHHDLPHLDQGFAWLVLAASTWLTSLVCGFIYCLGIFVEYWKSYYDCQTPAAVLSAATIGAMFFGAEPLSEFLTKKYNYWATVLPGCVLLSGGVSLAAIAPNISVTNATFGLLGGMGVALIYAPSLRILQEYFKEHFRMAMAILISISGIAQVAFPTLVRLLVNKQGKNSALILSAILLSGIPFGIFYVSRINKQGQLSKFIRKLCCMKPNEGHPGQIHLDETGLVHVGYTISLSNDELLVNQKEVERVLSAGVHDASNTQMVQSSMAKIHHFQMATPRTPSPGSLSVPSSGQAQGPVKTKLDPKQLKTLMHKELLAKHKKAHDQHATRGGTRQMPYLTVEQPSEQESGSSVSIDLAEDISGSQISEATRSEATAASSADRSESEAVSGAPSSMSFLGWSNNAAGGKSQRSVNNSAQDDKALAGYQGGRISDPQKHLKEEEEVLEIAKHQMTVMKDYFLDMARRHGEMANTQRMGNKESGHAKNNENPNFRSCQKTSAETELNEIITAPLNNSAAEQWQAPWTKDLTRTAFRQQANNARAMPDLPKEQVALTVKDYFVDMAKQQALSQLKNNSASDNYPPSASLHRKQDEAAATKNLVLSELLKASKVVQPVTETLSPIQGLDNKTRVQYNAQNQDDMHQFHWQVFENTGERNAHAALANNSARDNQPPYPQQSKDPPSNAKDQMLNELLRMTKKTEAAVETVEPPTTSTRNLEDPEVKNIAKQQMHLMRDYFMDMAKKRAEEEPQGSTIYERVLQKQGQGQQSGLGSHDVRRKTRDHTDDRFPHQTMHPDSMQQKVVEGTSTMGSYEDQENFRQEIQQIQHAGRQYMYPEQDTFRHSTEQELRETLHLQPTYTGYEEKLFAHPIERILEQRIINQTRQSDKERLQFLAETNHAHTGEETVRYVEDESPRKHILMDNREQVHQQLEKRHHQDTHNEHVDTRKEHHHAFWEETGRPTATQQSEETKRRHTVSEQDHEIKRQQEAVQEILWKFRRNSTFEKPRVKHTEEASYSQSTDRAKASPTKPLSDKVQKYTSILEHKSGEYSDSYFTGGKGMPPDQSSQVKHPGPQQNQIQNWLNEFKQQQRGGVSHLEYPAYYDDYYKGFKKPVSITQQAQRQQNEQLLHQKTSGKTTASRKSDQRQRPMSPTGKDKKAHGRQEEKRAKSPGSSKRQDEKRAKSPGSSKSKSPRSSPTGRQQKSILKAKKSQNATKQAKRTAVLQNALRQTSATLTTKLTKMIPKMAPVEKQSKTQAQNNLEVTFTKDHDTVEEEQPKLLSPPSRLPKFLQWGRPKQRSPEPEEENQSQTKMEETDASVVSVNEQDHYQTAIAKYLYRNQIPTAATEDASDTSSGSSSATQSKAGSDKKGASEAELLRVATELLYVLENPEDALERSQTSSAKTSSKRLTDSRSTPPSGHQRAHRGRLEDLSGDTLDMNASHHQSSHKTGRTSQGTGKISANSAFTKNDSGKSRAGQSGRSTENKESTKSQHTKSTELKNQKLDSFFSNSLVKSSMSGSAVSQQPRSARHSKNSVDEKFRIWMMKTFLRVDTSLVTNKRYIVYLISTACYTLGYFVPLFFTPLLSAEMDDGKHTGALMISILAATGLAGQFVLERLLMGINSLLISTLSLLFAGTILCLASIVGSGGLMALCGLYGFFAAQFIALRSIIVIELTVMRQLETANVLLELSQGITSFIGIMVAGALCDVFNTVRSAFVMGGVTMLLSGFLSATLVRPKLFKESKHVRHV